MKCVPCVVHHARTASRWCYQIVFNIYGALAAISFVFHKFLLLFSGSYFRQGQRMGPLRGMPVQTKQEKLQPARAFYPFCVAGGIRWFASVIAGVKGVRTLITAQTGAAEGRARGLTEVGLFTRVLPWSNGKGPHFCVFIKFFHLNSASKS